MATEEPQERKQAGDGSSPGEEAGGGEEAKGKYSAEEEKGAGAGGREGQGKRKRGRKPKGAPGAPKKEDEVEKKGGRKRASGAAKLHAVERPTRERKTVERFAVAVTQRAVATKAVSIQQGSGTKLKDIPNVFFKLSKRRVDENLKLLHIILFAKKAKALYLKRNIYQFSGFVWTENEEKHRAKVKEKLDKCVKEKLLDFCDVLDIAVSKATTKKEEISTKLLEFLESPHVTREIVLAEKEQNGRKRKRRTKELGEATSGDADSVGEPKRWKKSRESSVVIKRQKQSAKVIDEEEEEDDSADGFDENQAGAVEGSEENIDDTEDGGSEKEPVADKKISNQRQESKAPKSRVNLETTVKRGRPSKSARSSPGSPSKKSPSEGKGRAPGKSGKGTSMEQSKRGSKALTKQKAESTKKGSVKFDKSASDSKKFGKVGKTDSGPNGASKSKRDKGKGKNDEELAEVKEKKKRLPASAVYAKKQEKGTASGKAEPTREELQAAVRDILKEVDFNTATLADILRQLGSQFDTDLMQRKSEVKSIIEEVINDMTDDEEGGEDEDGEE